MTCRLPGAFLGAALLGALALTPHSAAKPPDLPASQPATVTPEVPPILPPGSGEIEGVWLDLSSGEVPTPADARAWPVLPSRATEVVSRKIALPLLLAIHPFIGALEEPAPECQQPPAPQAPAAPEFTCPYLREKSAPRQPAAQEQEVGGSVLDNLARLEMAGAGLELATELLREGHVAEGLACLEVVREMCPGSSYEERVNEVLMDLVAGVYASREEEAAQEQADEPEECPPDSLDILLDTRIDVDYTNVPLQLVLESLGDCQAVPLTVDLPSLQDGGVSLITPIHLRADGVPLRVALDLVCRQAGLECRVGQGGVVLACCTKVAQGSQAGEGQAAASGQEEDPVCPKAEALHRQHCAGVQEQVDGLLKACHLALADGRHEKAADLARQAHALDPERVEADPVVYKLHLLGGCAGPDPKEEDGHSECPAGPSNESSPNGYFLQPCLPPLDGSVVPALDNVLRQNEGFGSPCGAAQAGSEPGLAERVAGWVEEVSQGHGELWWGLDLGGPYVRLRMKAGHTSYHGVLHYTGLAVWTQPDDQADE